RLFGTDEKDFIKKDLKQKNFIEDDTQNPRIQKELKNIYRKLARMYHPDKISEKEEKEFLTRRMAEINEAFHRGDIESLKRYLKRAEAEMDGSMSSIERIKYLKLDMSVIRDMSEVYVLKINNLKKTEMCKLMSKNPEEREKVFNKTEERLKFDIKLNKKILKNLGT
ncbi:MAG: DnaJ domain-containing protein, partial [Elusimicrobiota bacterium]